MKMEEKKKNTKNTPKPMSKYNNKRHADREALVKKIDDYFAHCDANNIPYTVGDMCVYLDMSRATFNKYMKNEEGKIPEKVANKFRMACERIEAQYERMLLTSKNVVGIIFTLKCRFGWQDSTEYKTEIHNHNNFGNLTDDQLKKAINRFKINQDANGNPDVNAK